MGVPRGTTPTLTLTFSDPDLDLTTASDVYVTFRFGETPLTKTGEDLVITEKTIEVFLSQTETLAFPEGPVEVQANWMKGGKRAASDVAQYFFTKQLLEQEI